MEKKLAGWLRHRMAAWHRRKGYRFQGMDVLFLSTRGRKTGATRETPVAWFEDGDDAWLIVASAAGSEQHPAWYENLMANPTHASIELRDRRLQVDAVELDGPERDAAWKRIVDAHPRFAKYQAKTERLLPVIRLAPARSRPS